MQPGQETVENQHLDLESEAEAQENQKFQPSPRHLELLKIDGIACRSPENVFYAFASCAGLIGKTAPVSASRAIRILRNICCAPQAAQSFPVRPSAFLAIFPHLLRDLYRGTRRSMCRRIAAACTQLS